MAGYLRQKHNKESLGKEELEQFWQELIHATTVVAGLINPFPYRADYFGHKLYFDQNEKLVMYGVTHVAAIDGHSRFVVEQHAIMPTKNNLVIYDIYTQVYSNRTLSLG